MPMKIFVAQLATETNTFAASPSGLASFEEYGIYRGDASVKAPDTTGALMRFLRTRIEADGHQMVESICAMAQPSGCVVRSVYEGLRDQLLADLRAALPVQAVQLTMHGAMVAEGYVDCEGDLLSRAREIVGQRVPIGAELDLHCHFTELMRLSADVIIAYKEYPHVDGAARAAEIYKLLIETANGRVKPVTAAFDCRMVGLWHTTSEPMTSFVKRMQSFEGNDGVLSVSLGHGFPWGDVPEAGAKVWVVTDNDPVKARELAQELGREFWDLRDISRPAVVSVDAAIERALRSAKGPVVLADVADNAGGGAPADSTFILERLLQREVGNAVVGVFWDLGAIHICKAAGVGATFDLRLGGKCGPTSGLPIDLRVTVRAILDSHSQTGNGRRWPMGTSIWLETSGGVHLVLASVRNQVFGTDAFTGLGLSLEDKRIVVVKSTHHFYAQFAPIASEIIYVSTPGTITQDFANINYCVRDLDYWPRVADPHRFTESP
jgi:microcystin degradation protein MlrC